MGEITELLQRCDDDGDHAMGAIFARVYAELRTLAQAQLARGGGTMTATALVHEAYLRLQGVDPLSLSGQRHFFACAAQAMRQIVVDHYRRGSADKRGGGQAPVTLDTGLVGDADTRTLMQDIDQLLERLGRISARQREIVDLHAFAGLPFPEIARLLDCSERTVLRDWARARAFMHAQLSPDPDGMKT